MSRISRESPLKNKYVDIVLKKDGVIKLLVEAKAAGDKLRDRYVEQASYTPRRITTTGSSSRTGSSGTSTT